VGGAGSSYTFSDSKSNGKGSLPQTIQDDDKSHRPIWKKERLYSVFSRILRSFMPGHEDMLSHLGRFLRGGPVSRVVLLIAALVYLKADTITSHRQARSLSIQLPRQFELIFPSSEQQRAQFYSPPLSVTLQHDQASYGGLRISMLKEEDEASREILYAYQEMSGTHVCAPGSPVSFLMDIKLTITDFLQASMVKTANMNITMLSTTMITATRTVAGTTTRFIKQSVVGEPTGIGCCS
jgi:hypothetical protein